MGGLIDGPKVLGLQARATLHKQLVNQFLCVQQGVSHLNVLGFLLGQLTLGGAAVFVLGL